MWLRSCGRKILRPTNMMSPSFSPTHQVTACHGDCAAVAIISLNQGYTIPLRRLMAFDEWHSYSLSIYPSCAAAKRHLWFNAYTPLWSRSRFAQRHGEKLSRCTQGSQKRGGQSQALHGTAKNWQSPNGKAHRARAVFKKDRPTLGSKPFPSRKCWQRRHATVIVDALWSCLTV